eukprot:scaffold23429_cov118-Isochrysis_galbana.AAC.2
MVLVSVLPRKLCNRPSWGSPSCRPNPGLWAGNGGGWRLDTLCFGYTWRDSNNGASAEAERRLGSG